MKITYTPGHDDNESTIVDGITFNANEPVEIPDIRRDLIQKLSANPWFRADDVAAQPVPPPDAPQTRDDLLIEELHRIEDLIHQKS